MNTPVYSLDSVVFVLITTLDEFSLFPELYKSLKHDQDPLSTMIKYFGGRTIYIPSRKEYEDLVQKAAIFCAVQNAKDRTKAIGAAVKRYSIPPSKIQAIVKEVGDVL